MPELKACGVLIIRGNPIREFLLMKHAERWDLPKGHLDPGESETECARRELAEETGIAAEDVELIPGFRFSLRYQVRSSRTGGAWWWKELVVFLGRLRRERAIVVTEHLDYKWFPWNPPHAIQEQTIDPLLRAVESYFAARPPHRPEDDNDSADGTNP
jgi:8-oxo-dGTP pyrophosphatase MutT (NUDIX family)